MPTSPLALAQALIRCPSVTPVEGGALAFIAQVLGDAGFEVHRPVFSEPGTPDIDNLYARFGIGRPPGRQDPADFVLKRFSGTERKELEFAVDLAADAAEALLHDGLEAAQNRFHALSG